MIQVRACSCFIDLIEISTALLSAIPAVDNIGFQICVDLFSRYSNLRYDHGLIQNHTCHNGESWQPRFLVLHYRILSSQWLCSLLIPLLTSYICNPTYCRTYPRAHTAAYTAMFHAGRALMFSKGYRPKGRAHHLQWYHLYKQTILACFCQSNISCKFCFCDPLELRRWLFFVLLNSVLLYNSQLAVFAN